MDRATCMRYLGRCGVGRVGLSVHALPAIFPVNYAMLDDDIVFQTGPGTKLDVASAGAVVAFEVDGSDAMSHSGWSVLVVGQAAPITDPAELDRAALLPLSPWAGGERDILVRVQATLVSGRKIADRALDGDQ